MKAPDFAYHRPERLVDAIELLGRLENAKLLAGGQSLMPMLNMRYIIPDHLIDINRIAGLDEITMSETEVRVGALARQRAIERHAELRRRAPIFSEALARVGHYQTRTRGTLGGSLCHLDPAAELVLLAALHDAVLHVAGAGASRDIRIDTWPTGYMAPALAADEVLTAVSFPLWRDPCGEAFLEFARRHGDFALAAAAARVALANGRISRIAVALGGVAIAPVRLRGAEAALVGAAPDRAAADLLATEVEALDVMSDAQVSSDYRKSLAATLARRVFVLAAQRASEQSHVRN
jgi:CO/xanthine dehydrogenase FAD-binding subunit